MELLIIILSLTSHFVVGMQLPDNELLTTETLQSNNMTNDSNKEMYVIHAMVYQVGIITNKTDDEANSTGIMGNQEAVTFFHTNGSGLDLSQINDPLVTNVTAQRLVGVAPADQSVSSPLSWNQLKEMASQQHDPNQTNTLFKRSSGPKPNEDETKEPVKLESGTALIPQEAGLQSIGIPPLLMLNNNFSEIPVPIPNTSVVHYAKVNTLIQNTP